MAALAEVDRLLRGTGRFSVREATVPWRHLALYLGVGGFLYGTAMGLFNLRFVQALYSGLKVPLLLVVSTVVCLPSFFVLNTVLGLRDDFTSALKGVIAAQATLAVALVAQIPVTVLLYLSSDHYNLALMFNGLVFFVGAIAGQATLSRHYRPLIRKDPRHRAGWLLWLVLYVFVAIQTAWVLRPFVGKPTAATQFFREDAWTNAYVAVLRKLAGLFAGES